MKIFNRGTDPKTGAAPTAAAATVPAPAAASKLTAPAAPAPAAAAPSGAAPSAPAPAPNVPPAPDLAVILDANVKEMSEKIARLASTLDTANQERTGFEAKIEQMEERMRKLSSLTEMISAQYNPFVGEAPMERGEMPRPEVGLAPPPVAIPPSALASFPPPPPPVASAEPALSLQIEPPPAPEFSSLPPLDGALLGSPELAPPPPMMAAPQMLEPPMMAPYAALPQEAPMAAEPGVYLWQIQPGFEPSMLLLGWADMLLKSAGSRESLLELVNYYHNIGWIGDPARDQLLAYADGLTAPQDAAVRDWRADVEVHEKSLLFVEKLRAVSMRRSYA